MIAKNKRIPKRIGGVKVPKELRRAGEALLDKAASPEGKMLIAGGLSMAAAAIATAAQKRAAPPTAPEAPRPPAPPQGIADPNAIGDAVGQAIDTVLSRFAKR